MQGITIGGRKQVVEGLLNRRRARGRAVLWDRLMKWLIAVVLLALAAGAVSVWLGQHEAGGLFGLLAASALGGAGKLKRVRPEGREGETT